MKALALISPIQDIATHSCPNPESEWKERTRTGSHYKFFVAVSAVEPTACAHPATSAGGEVQPEAMVLPKESSEMAIPLTQMP